MHYGDHYFKESTVIKEPVVNESLREVMTTKKEENLKKISEKFVLDKFSNKISNANQWLEEFEGECERFDIEKNEKKIETLKYLLEKPILDWYSSMVIKFSINSDWNIWKSNFRETYGNKGWSNVKYAFGFRYQAGSLIDYATKKERLLLEVNKFIDTLTLINLIVLGLPEEIMNKINREPLKETTQLFTELSKHEYLGKKKKWTKSEKQDQNLRKQAQRNHVQYAKS